MSLDEDIDVYFDRKRAVHKAFGYKPDWVEIPLCDARQMFWMLFGGEGPGARAVWSDEPMTVESIRDGARIWSGPVYTQRFLEKWVYRMDTHVLVAVNTQTDGNKFLMIFDATKECTDDALRKEYAANW